MRNSVWFIKGVDVLAGIRTDDLSKLARASRIDKYPREQIFSLPNAPAQAVYILRSGRMKYVRLSPDDTESVSVEIASGEIFGACPPADNRSFPYFLLALEDCEIWVLSKADFQGLVAGALGEVVFRAYTGGFRRRMVESKAWSLLHTDVPERLALLLSSLGKGLARQGSNGMARSIPLTPEALARLAGLTPPCVLLTLAGMASKGILRVRRSGSIVIKDPPALQALSRRARG